MAAGSQSFLGQVCIMGYNALPTGYASCQGQLLSIASNTALFSILGTIYGGNGVTTFALPDMQGRVVVGAGNTYTLGQTGGSATNTLTIANLPSHTHNAPFPSLNVLAGGAANTISPVNNYPAVVSDKLYGPNVSVSAVQLITANTSVSSAGGGASTYSNLQAYQVLNFIIALTGIFPARS